MPDTDRVIAGPRCDRNGARALGLGHGLAEVFTGGDCMIRWAANPSRVTEYYSEGSRSEAVWLLNDQAAEGGERGRLTAREGDLKSHAPFASLLSSLLGPVAILDVLKPVLRAVYPPACVVGRTLVWGQARGDGWIDDDQQSGMTWRNPGLGLGLTWDLCVHCDGHV